MENMEKIIQAGEYFSSYHLDSWNMKYDTQLSVEIKPADEFLVPQRLDLMCKLEYIDCKENKNNMSFAKELYKEHIKAFSEGTYVEPGSEEKNSIEKYFNSFDKLIDDIKTHGFDLSKSVIPVSDDGVILDGSHRVAIAIYYGLSIPTVKIHNVKRDFGAEFFLQRGLKQTYVDYIAYKYMLCKDNVYVVCLWPRTHDRDKLKLVDALIKTSAKVFYKKDVQLNYNGLRQLMIHLYHEQDWTGNIDNAYAGIDSKATACYAPEEKTEVYFIEGVEQTRVVQLKQRIRDIYQIENHSVHITDTKAEAIEAGQVLLNSNSIHLMNYGKPFKFAKSIKKYLQIPADERIVQNNSTPALYGIAQVNEVNLVSDDEVSLNPEKYLYYFGRKTIALREIKPKDILTKLRIRLLLNKKKQPVHHYKSPKIKTEKQPSKVRRCLAQSFENNSFGTLIIRAYRHIRYSRKPKKYKNIENLRDAFEKISKASDYLVLRNWEGFYDDILLEGHNDIDLLCASPESRDKIIKILDAKDLTFDGYHYSFLYRGSEVTLDTRTVGDNYYDTAWQINMLKNKKKHPLGFYVMSDEDYFYSLAYHAIYQKKTGLSDEYRNRLDSMNDGEAHTQDEYISMLDKYMKKNGYGYTKPKDESVVFIK